MESSERARARGRLRRGWLVNSGLVLALVVVLGVAVAGLLRNPAGDAARSLRTVPVLKGQVTQTVSASGSVVSAQSASVNFSTSGTVSSVSVHPGDKVSQGQRLATLERSQPQRQLDAAYAQLTVAQEALDNAESKGGDTASQRSQVAQAKVQVGQAQQSVDQTTLTSPVSGTVTAVNGQVGDRVTGGNNTRSTGQNTTVTSGSGTGSGSAASGSQGSSSSQGSQSGSGSSGDSGSAGSSASSSGTAAGSTAFMSIYDLDHLQVKAQFAEVDAAKLQVGHEATVSVNALPDQPVKAHVAAIDPVAGSSSSVVQYGVTLNLDTSTAPGLKPGQSVSVQVDVNRVDQVLYLPAAAVQGSGAEATVVVLEGAQQVRRPVRVGLRGDQTTQLLSGVSAGDRVVIPAANPATTGQPTRRGPFGGGQPGGGGQ